MHKILLVEDDENSSKMLTARLERREYQVALATTGEQALEMVDTENPDLILMDIRLPDIDGYETTRRIRERPDEHPVPIIALTAHALDHDREKAMEAGCNDYHAKPVSWTKLRDQMETLLGDSQG